MSRIDYSGKKVSIGMDVHKKTYTVTCVVEREVVNRTTMPASPEKLVEFIQKRFAGAQVQTAYEALV